MSTLMTQLLERLAEMFPKQDFETRLERYIASHYPKNAADVEHWLSEYNYKSKEWNY